VADAKAGRGEARSKTLNVALFLITIVSVFMAGAVYLPAKTLWEMARNGLEFTAALMGILVCHEAGHYIAARRRDIETSLPYFIPAPPFISYFGTFGAVILMRGRIRSRNALIEVGAAGPLAGMAVAVPLLFIGLADCPVGPIPTEGFIEGQSLLYMLAKWVVLGPIPAGYDVYIDQSPLAWAGWIGMLVTMLNLLPIGQLDGGHVFYALFGELQARASAWFVRALFALGAAVLIALGMDAWSLGLRGDDLLLAAMPGAPWLLLGTALLLLNRSSKFRHPPTDASALSPLHAAVGVLSLLVFVVTFMPILMRPIV
jgi:membrane-associated protease RseP (regulator of RpoE activity)